MLNLKKYNDGMKKLKKVAGIALVEAKKLGVTQAEVVLWVGSEELTRFANNQIHQSVAVSDSMLHVRVVLGKRIGVAKSNRFDREGIFETVKTAYELALLQREDPSFVSLPLKSKYKKIAQGTYVHGKHLGTRKRAVAVGKLINAVKQAGFSSSGAFLETESETAVANSLGVWAYHKGSSASLTTIVSSGKGSGYAGQSARLGGEIDVSDVVSRAIYKAGYGEPVEVLPGEYEVILESPAVAEMLDFFAWLGPNARIFHEDVSFLCGKVGKKVLSESISITDDPFDVHGYPVPFDYEGFPKRKITLIEKGIANAVVYDSYHAQKYGAENTGHALPAPNTWGPIPTHLVIKKGNVSQEKMIRSVKKGLLITRFWYTRVLHHKQLILTGMTRDGTFLIENGKIVGRAKNLRYTESVLKAFSDIRGIGNKLSLEGSEGGFCLVPALLIGKFRFTGGTQHG